MAMKLRELAGEDAVGLMKLSIYAGEDGLDRVLTNQHIQKPGLLLTGMLEGLHEDRIQVFGAAEVGYLKILNSNDLTRTIGLIDKASIPAIIVTRGLEPPDALVELAGRKAMPLFTTKLSSSVFIERLTGFLDEWYAMETTLHGVLVDVLGIGILIMGKSGVGKSECALDLIIRGYRLVADDAVIVKRKHPYTLFGEASDIISYHMEIRGLGIINIKDIFGITAIRKKKLMDLVVELVEWAPDGDYERLGFDEMKYDILGVELPYLRIPISPGRSVATIVEIAARNRILKIMGYDSTRQFEAHLNKVIASESGKE